MSLSLSGDSRRLGTCNPGSATWTSSDMAQRLTPLLSPNGALVEAHLCALRGRVVRVACAAPWDTRARAEWRNVRHGYSCGHRVWKSQMAQTPRRYYTLEESYHVKGWSQ